MARLLLVPFSRTGLPYPAGCFVAVGTLAAAARRRGHDVELLIAGSRRAARRALAARLARARPDVVGLSVMESDFPLAAELASLAHRAGARAVLGGVYPTLEPERALAAPGVAHVCVGEGEGPLVELLDALDEGRSARDVPNLWSREGDRVVRTPLRPPADLDRVPPPDLDLLYPPGATTYWTYASVGCPNVCRYCCNAALRAAARGLGPFVRRKSIATLIGELAEARRRRPFERVIFVDPLFTSSRRWLVELCDVYGREIGLPFDAAATIDTVDPDLLGRLRAAGCRHLAFGIESGSPRVREALMGKRIGSNAEIRRALAEARRAGIGTLGYFVLGVPGETPGELAETERFARSLPLDEVCVSTAVPYRGTELRRDWEAYGPPPDPVPATIRSGETCLALPASHRRRVRRAYRRIANLTTWRKYPLLVRAPALRPLYAVAKLALDDATIERLWARLAALARRARASAAGVGAPRGDGGRGGAAR